MHPNRAHLIHLSGPQGYDRPALLPKEQAALRVDIQGHPATLRPVPDRKSTRLNSSHARISYAGSFYAFAIWLGLGMLGLARLLERAKLPKG